MMQFDSDSQAYEAMAKAALEFPADRPWDELYARYRMYNKMVAAEWGLKYRDHVDERGKSPSREFRNASMDAALFLRDDLLKKTGHRIWGLTFILFSNGKFKVEYDYNKPEGYEETEEMIEVDLTKDIPGTRVDQ